MVTMQDAIAMARETKTRLLELEQELQDPDHIAYILNLTLEDLGLDCMLGSARDFLHKAGAA